MPCPASASRTSDVAATPGSNGLDVNGRLSVLETHVRHQAETNARIDAEIQRQRDRWHSLGNVVNGWPEVERSIDALKQISVELQAEVKALRVANDKLQGPGGAIEQLNSLAEDRRFKRRMLGWAAWLSGAIATGFALLQMALPYLRWPGPKP